ncbi:MAG: hypothetical protein R3A80_08135 [Bdellovibrionota bacterium]
MRTYYSDKRIVSTAEVLERKELYSFKLKGFVNHQYREEFSREKIGQGGYAYAYIDLLPMGAVDWFELDKVQMFPGMRLRNPFRTPLLEYLISTCKM